MQYYLLKCFYVGCFKLLIYQRLGKNGTQYLPAWHSAKGVGLGGACSGVSESTLYGLWCPVGVVGSTPEPVDLCRVSPPISLPLSCHSLSCPINKGKSPKKYILKKKMYKSLIWKHRIYSLWILHMHILCTCKLDDWAFLVKEAHDSIV